jgi:hypothetical protein
MISPEPVDPSSEGGVPSRDWSLVLPDAECDELANVLRTVPAGELLHDRADQIQPARRAVRNLVRACRANDPIRPEQMIIALRRWYYASVILHDGHATDHAVWTRIVAMCLDEFYAGEHEA